MQPTDLQNLLKTDPASPSEIFDVLKIVSRYALEHGATEKHALDAIIRLRDLANRGVTEDQGVIDAISSLCREAGLFPYLAPRALTWRDRVAFEFFRGPETLDYVFHREQWYAFRLLLAGKSMLLSAPTSFGKSVLIHAFIAERRPTCVVIVVPTIALLDQFRRRLSDSFGNTYSIITRNDQTVGAAQKRIFVVTQERLLERDDISEIDLLAIDEYYKLDSDREKQGDGRADLLNVALRKYLNVAKQIFFLGPTVANVEMRDDLRVKFEKVTSEFSPVAVDVRDFTGLDAPYRTIASLLREYRRDKSLVFSKSPPSAMRLARYLTITSPLNAPREVFDWADWLAEHYHPDWSLVSALRKGYGIHHGSVPRSVAQALVRIFNEGGLNALICTSTLIEGVNTSAKNVFIFDKKISNTNYDYFDFRNIAGRSGRMGQHLVGRIFLFHEPPEMHDFELHIPALGDDAALPDSVLLNLPDDTLGDSARFRKQALLEKSRLPPELVKRFAPYGLNGLERLSEQVGRMLEARDQSLLWRGYVGYEELLAVFSISWPHLKFNKKRMSAKAAAFYGNRFRVAQSLRPFFDGLVGESGLIERREIIEKGFRALAAFDYAIPKLLVDMEALVNFHCARLGIDEVSYDFMAQSLDNLFCHHWVKALDEYGVPIPLGRKIDFVVRDSRTLEDAISDARSYSTSTAGMSRLTSFERNIIGSALR
jgi:hypothetical protein